MKLVTQMILLCLFTTIISCNNTLNKNKKLSKNKSAEVVQKKEITFKSQGIKLAGSIYIPTNPDAAIVIVHGSDSVPRMTKFAELLAKNNMLVLTYDKRGVGESEGTYMGPEVGTNNISTDNLKLLAKDASAAVNVLQQKYKNIPIGLLGFSQAGWIIPITANDNSYVKFMVLFSCPTITTLEQLRFQFYTNGNPNFWENHTEKEAKYHTKNDPDRYQFKATDPNDKLNRLSIPGLWLFGKKDIQIPVQLCIENLNILKEEGKPFEYKLFPNLGHNTGYSASKKPFNVSIQWIKTEVEKFNK
ncbi:alpha/beta hydrolase [uncultured Tenacibaculum sp.]|uniref:alpha/beta hydrolase family protein n=1 Tax=uncultured Tenacibaculum sp. TaxID=174713 RepID=UPI0026050027|nr:alpha/beta hydrolase [uncultured Tenacibaculum sp.]